MIYENEMHMPLNIWGRDFDIKIFMDIFDGEEITEGQKETLNKFLECQNNIFAQAYENGKKYCIEKYSEKVNKENFNIFSYIIPKSIYISRSNDDKRIAGLFCKFRFDQENDLVFYIENEQFVKIGSQDIIL